jgi:hypothetical protein
MATFLPDLGLWAYLTCQAAALILVWIYASFAEWGLHKYIMHSKFIPRFPFNAHALVHHKLFRADESFHASSSEQFEHVTFNWTDHLILNGIHIALFMGVEWLIGLPIVIGAFLAILTYLFAYETIHYVFHVPKGRFFEKHSWFRWLKHHHLIHHKQQFKNLNVVLPVADFLLRTRRATL